IISLPLYELTEALFDLLKENLASTDTVYIQAFLDLVNEYAARKTADLDGFLVWWDEAKEKKSLFSPEDQDAIQLMTIHKSKGLQFGAVILPFADWTFEPDYMRSPILWCKPEVEPFNELGIVPVKYVKSLTNTIFKREYLYEKLFMFIDNLNLLYVAFTRPKHRLIVNTPNPGNFNEIKRVSQLLRHSVNTSVLGDALEEKEEKQDKNESEAEQLEKKMLTFNYGEPIKEVESVESDKGSKGDNDDKVDLEQQATLNKWESIPFRNRLKMRLSGIGYFTDDGSRDFGTLMHNIVSEINTLDDLDGALERRLLSGELTSEDKHNLYDELRKSLSLPQVIDWYSGNYRVLNEQEVLHPSMSFIRPDRVMINNGEVIVVDYKFGDLVESKYVKQVQRYLKSIRGMGYDNVKGYLFYVKLHKVVKV
ncbi:MAG TPA: ATP-dependent helicase, partial [Bacteroidales bacterium]|nr:ATP-dependent helicase [Bacteroidales bacterium]